MNKCNVTYIFIFKFRTLFIGNKFTNKKCRITIYSTKSCNNYTLFTWVLSYNQDYGIKVSFNFSQYDQHHRYNTFICES